MLQTNLIASLKSPLSDSDLLRLSFFYSVPVVDQALALLRQTPVAVKDGEVFTIDGHSVLPAVGFCSCSSPSCCHLLAVLLYVHGAEL